MAQAWRWRAISEKKTPLEQLILLLNVNLGKLGTALVSLFSSIESVDTFPGGAATPSIYGASMWLTNNSVGTVITNFLDGTPGKAFTVWASDANTTIQNNANIKTKSGANIVMTATDVRTFASKDGLLWRET
jgi:hypothetical protein